MYRRTPPYNLWGRTPPEKPLHRPLWKSNLLLGRGLLLVALQQSNRPAEKAFQEPPALPLLLQGGIFSRMLQQRAATPPRKKLMQQRAAARLVQQRRQRERVVLPSEELPLLPLLRKRTLARSTRSRR